MPSQYEELSCPFCDKGRIACLYFPSITSIKRSPTATFGSSKKLVKTSDIWLIQSGCTICGKNQEEIEKELKRKEII